MIASVLLAAACAGPTVETASTAVPPTSTSHVPPSTSAAVSPTATTSPTTTRVETPETRSGRFDEPQRLAVLGSLPLTPSVTDVWGHVDERGREYAIVGSRIEGTSRGTLYIVDVTDPADPVVAAQIADVPAFDVKARGHHVYASDDQEEGVIVDVTDPYAPEVVGSTPSAHNFFFDDAGHLYLGRGDAGLVFSVVGDPAVPVPLDISIPPHHDSVAIGDRLYVFGGSDATYIYDIENRIDPALLGVLDDPLVEYHHSGWPTEDGSHLFIADETATGDRPDLTVWDISRPSQPVLVGSYTDHGAAAHNIQVVGRHAFLSYYGAGIVVLDVTNPADPRLVARHDPIPGTVDGWAFADYGTLGIYAGSPSGVLYASGSEGLTLLRFTPPRLPFPELR